MVSCDGGDRGGGAGGGGGGVRANKVTPLSRRN